MSLITESIGHNLPNNPFLKKREQEWIYGLAALERLFFKVGWAADFSTEANMFFFPDNDFYQWVTPKLGMPLFRVQVFRPLQMWGEN